MNEQGLGAGVLMGSSVMARLSSIVALFRPYRGAVAGVLSAMLVLASTTAAFAWVAGPLVTLLGSSWGDNRPLTLSIPGLSHTFTAASEVAVTLSTVVIGLAMVRGTAAYVQGFLVASIQQNVVRDLRRQVVEAVLWAPPWRYPGKPGDLATQVTADIQQIEAIVSVVLAPALQNALVLAALGAFAFSKAPGLAFVGLALLPVVAGLLWKANQLARAAFRQALDARGRLAERLVETFSALDVVKAFRVERARAAILLTEIEDVRKLTLRARRVGLALGPVVLVTGAVVLAAILVLGTRAVESRELSAESFVSLLAALMLAYRPIQGLGASLGVFAIGLAALDRVSIHRRSRAETEVPTPPADAISVDGVSVDIDGKRILTDVHLTLEPSETVVLRGANGAGKTTLLSTLMGLCEPASGSIRVGGSPVSGARALRGLFGWVPQEPVLFEGSVLENLALGAEPDPDRAEAVLREVSAWGLVASLPDGLESILARRGQSLSMGQRQLLCLARALYRDPPFLLLDEPTASLDAEAEQEFLRAIEGLSKKRGILLVTHRSRPPFEARVVVMSHGRVVEEVATGSTQAAG
jgi:ABC-type multidrug transport system fused ATPase/permease subunit